MDSLPFVIGFGLLAAALITLYLLQSRTLQRNFDTFREDTAKTLAIGVEMSRSELAGHRERASQQSRDLTETVQHLAETQAESSRALVTETLRQGDLQATRLLNGSRDSQQQTIELMQSLAAHIGTKDTAGYERVMAAAGTPIRTDPDAPPYAVPQEDEETEQLREALTSDDAAAALLRSRLNGGRATSGTGFFGPYPGGTGDSES